MNKIILLFALFIASANSFAGDIEKAFKYLNTGDYPNAKKYLVEAITDEPDNAAANFGMAKFYFLKDNKLYNVDSANIYIKRAAKKMPLDPEDKQSKKYLKVGVRDYTIQALQQEISQAAYFIVEKLNTVESYQFFLDNYTDPGLINRSKAMRNQLAYIRARAANDPVALDEFLKKYPGSDQEADAKQLYEKLLYEHTTADKSAISYKNYLDKYPNGPYAKEAKKSYDEKLLNDYNNKHDLGAYLEFERNHKDHPAYLSIEDSIYKMVTAPGTVEAFKNFVNSCKNNPNYNDAWIQLYTLYTADGTEESYRKFLEEFPGFPEKGKIYKDMESAKVNLKPFQQGNKWGYASQPAPDSLIIVIPLEYEEAFSFNSGLAAVRSIPCTDTKCTYFYIDKSNKPVFKDKFNYAGDFDKGFAVVGIGNCEVDSCKYGMIDKRGNWVIKPEYDEMDGPTEDLYMVAKDERYGFINQKGDAVISLKYNNAVAFSEGIAAVAIDTNWFFIDKSGKQLFFDYFHDVSVFKNGLCAVTKDGENWGYIDRTGTFVIQPVYEAAEDFENGYGIVSKKEKDPLHKGLFISQRYKIDSSGKILEKLTAPKSTAKKTAKKKGRK
ncbi:MAG: hypothetical protein JWO06_3959 [Bacteroidota bacterium]|nr:hypothetical protein [Bacteroidota bacterium]